MTYLFDFDGTLVDSMPTFSRVMLDILDESGVAYDDEVIRIITPLGLNGTAEYFAGLGVNSDAEAIKLDMGRRLLHEYVHNIPAKANVESALREMKARGDELSILTASPHITLDPCLKRLGLYELFTNVWSCDDFGTTKADPEIYRMVARRMGRPVGEILFLDDNCDACGVASSAGMRVCGVFDETSADYEERIKEFADHYIHDFSQLPALI